MEVTLMELLDSREARVRHQKELLETYCSAEKAGGSSRWDNEPVLISITLNIPGPVKDKPAYRKLMEYAVSSLEEACREEVPEGVFYKEARYLKTGAEGYIVIGGMAAEAVKSKAIAIENGSEAGRLLDIDVLTMKGGISRTKLGFEQRKCLLCDKPAKECARSQRHSMEELLAEVDRIAESL